MKDFFKSTAFKCIAVLVSIALLCSGVLAILNNVLSVSEEERTSRAIQKIYGEEKEYEDYQIDSKIDVSDFGEIDLIYKILNDDSSYDLLFKTVGKEGYKNGTITLWVQVSIKEKNASIEKTVLESYEKQTLMSKLGSSYYEKFNLEEIDSNYFTVKNGENSNVISGATKSSNACCNAVNCVIKYVREALNK